MSGDAWLALLAALWQIVLWTVFACGCLFILFVACCMFGDFAHLWHSRVTILKPGQKRDA